MELIMASQNANKIAEIQARLSEFKIRGLDKERFPNELLEEGGSLEANALQKARQVYAVTGTPCFADDTGLEVDALGGEPGVRSARYAGEEKSSEANMDKLLAALGSRTDRSARFRTVIALILDGKEFLFEGICNGRISQNRAGDQGFGYDPIFIPEGEQRSFAQMDMASKNNISHRGRAVDALINFLKSQVEK